MNRPQNNRTNEQKRKIKLIDFVFSVVFTLSSLTQFPHTRTHINCMWYWWVLASYKRIDKESHQRTNGENSTPYLSLSSFTTQHYNNTAEFCVSAFDLHLSAYHIWSVFQSELNCHVLSGCRVEKRFPSHSSCSCSCSCSWSVSNRNSNKVQILFSLSMWICWIELCCVVSTFFGYFLR
jgi:hypothetical protein